MAKEISVARMFVFALTEPELAEFLHGLNMGDETFEVTADDSD